MASTKPQKDKAFGGSPRLMPRQTAASAARAARNATNRNLTPSQRQSPNRPVPPAPPTTTAHKGKNASIRNAQKTDSKSDIKINRCPENEPEQTVDSQQVVSYVIIDNTVVIGDDNANHDEPADCNTCVQLEEINENDVFEIKHDDPEYPDQIELQTPNANEHIRSRPQTPTSNSRPQTPKSLPSSRPETPLSRPATAPAPAPARHGTPASRPTTPQRIPTRPTTPRTPLHTPLPPLPPSRHTNDDEDIKSVYTLKQKQFHRMKKELDLKQQAILEVFDTLRALRDRMHREGLSGGGEGNLQELVVFNVGDWTSEEVSQLCRDASGSSAEGAVELLNSTVPIDDCALQDLDTRVMNVPNRFADLCLQAFSARQELIDWIKELIENKAFKDDLGVGECMQRIAQYNSQGLQLCEALRELKNRADDAVDTVSQLSRRACRERSALIAVGESLVREIAKLRQDIESRTAIVNEMREMRTETETNKVLEETRRELEEERAARAAAKDKLATSESQLRQMRIRINKMDRQLREAEASISSLTGTVKTLEDQSRQREVQLEARARKLKESLKTGEVASGHLAQQRDALQNEVMDLKEQIEKMNTEHKACTQELTSQLKEINASFDEHRKMYQREVALKETIEAALLESQNTVEELRAKITELENSRPNPDLPTEREMDLWAELQATKDTLRITEDEVTACKREKVRFLETLTKIAESENKVGMQQKLAAELLSKEEIMAKMQIQIRELTKNIKLNEQKVIQYEQYVRDLQAHNRAVANCQQCPNGISYEDLQQEIMNLKMNLLEAVHRNEELTEALVQKDQQLEQQDKTSRAQARVIKVNKQIAAKAEEIQELFGTLENKQQQIHRLEKIVLALEEQQRRAQAQRIRHEEKIAALEHELAAGGNRRERKFIFF